MAQKIRCMTHKASLLDTGVAGLTLKRPPLRVNPPQLRVTVTDPRLLATRRGHALRMKLQRHKHPLAADAFIAAFYDGGTNNEALAASSHQSVTYPPPRPLAPPPQAASGGSAAEEVFALASVVSSSSECGNACEGEDALATHWCSSLLVADMLY